VVHLDDLDEAGAHVEPHGAFRTPEEDHPELSERGRSGMLLSYNFSQTASVAD
jgi:hypothetical protein